MKLALFFDHVRDAAAERSCPVSEMLKTVKNMGVDYVELDGDRLEDPVALKKMKWDV